MRESGPREQEDHPTIAQLRRFAGPPREFWPLFLRCARNVTGARRATLAVRVEMPAPDGEGLIESWRILTSQPSGGATLPEATVLALALAEGIARTEDTVAFAVGGAEAGEGVVVLEAIESAAPVAVSSLVALLGALPETWQAERTTRQLQAQLRGLTDALDLGLVVGAQQHFTAAALAACNELAARLNCDRVSLGWQDDTVLRLRAISQADKFDRRSTIVRQAEVAMEETFDQEEILSCPPPAGSDMIVREHATYAREAAVAFLCSVPLAAKKETLGVWLLERGDRPLDEGEQALLRVMADQVGPRLAELREQDRFWVVRLWRKFKRQAAGVLGPRHTGPKLAGLAAALGLLFLVFGRLPYAVEAPATVRSGQVVFVTAPFDGFIEEVAFEVGDTVAAGNTLVRFDTRELLIQKAAELANLNRFNNEVERARAQNALADMRVAKAQADRARAVLDRTEYHLQRAVIAAPIDGVIVEGDLRKRIGAPVRQGEVLLQQARLDELYIRIEIPEREVHEIFGRTGARMLFASQPDDAFELEIVRLQPGGMPVASGVIFEARAESIEAPPDWWRPGMSGTVRIDAGWRNAGWILTHKTTDWLRRQLWW